MSSADSWQTAEVGGPKKATVITKPAMAKDVIGRARSPVLLLGNGAASVEFGDQKLIDYLLVLVRMYQIPMIATGHINRALRERGYENALVLPAVEAGQRIADPGWKGPGGKGPCDLAIVAGLPYPMAWTLLSGLKHFAPHTRTLTLENKYQPNATWSCANLSEKDWQEFLEEIVAGTSGGAADV